MALGARRGAPALLGTLNIVGSAEANTLAVAGTHAFVGTRAHPSGPELFVVDLATPGAPSVVGTWEAGAEIRRIVVQGPYAYLATARDDSELVILSIADKSAPTVAGTYDADGDADAVSVSVVGATTFLGTADNPATGGKEFRVLNTSIPTHVAEVGSYDIEAEVTDIAVSGTTAYVGVHGGGRSELAILDVATPGVVAPTGSYQIPHAARVNAIAMRRGKLYLATGEGLAIVDAQPTPRLLGSLDLGGSARSVAVFRDRAYVATDIPSAPLNIVSIGAPAAPYKVDAHAADDAGRAVVVDGARAYLLTTGLPNALRVLDITSLLRPNIVVIQTDDQRWDSLASMPLLLRHVADQGFTATSSYVVTPTCAPSRASLLTGLYTHNHGVETVWHRPLIGKDRSTVATWLQAAGYRTGMVGKYINKYAKYCPNSSSCYIPFGWNEWHAFLRQSSYNYTLAENGELVRYGAAATDYATDVLKNKAIEFINANDGRPFFLYLAPHTPHVEVSGVPRAAPRHEGVFAGTPSWRPSSYDEEDMTDKAAWLGTQPRAATVRTGRALRTYGDWTDAIRIKQLEALQAVDEAVRDIIVALEAIGEAEDTVVVYTSDNGLLWGEHRGWGTKGMPYEEAIRVPLVVRYPRLIRSKREEPRLIQTIDLAPTLAALAGTQPKTAVDGQSFVHLMTGEPGDWRSDLLVEQMDSVAAGPFTLIRQGRWKYIEWKSGFAELYDLVDDPHELRNLAGSEAVEHVSRRDALRARLEELRQQR